MNKSLFSGFWEKISKIILKNRVLIVLSLLTATYFFTTHWDNIRFTYTEANLLPATHPENIKYKSFTDKFGEEGNLIVISVKDSTLFTIEKLNAWNELSHSFKDHEDVSTVIAFGDLQKLKKNKSSRQFYIEPFIKDSISEESELELLKDEIFNNSPFYDKFLINSESKAVRTAINLKTEVVNTVLREQFVNNVLLPRVSEFEQKYNLDVRISGMPYVRTKYSETIKAELGKFLILALIVTSLIFFLFFRSFRATLISIIAVSVGVMWTLGIVGILEYELTVLTAIIPPLIIVIGMPNCIFLINKYQHELNKHGDKSLALQKVITKIGNVTLMTNVTTASGFATFITTDSKLLNEFGLVASLSILSIFILCLLIIPIVYSFLPKPDEKHLEHQNKKWINNLLNWMVSVVKTKRIEVYTISVMLLALSIIGIYKIEISGSFIDDMPRNTEFFDDILYYEKEFNGILPLEIYIDSKRKKSITKLSTIKKMEIVENLITKFPELSRPISVVSLVKYSKQAFYNGNPKYYQVPTSQENSFILSYAKNSTSDVDLLNNFVDSTGQYTRITTFMKDMKIERMERIEEELNAEIEKVMPSDRFEVFLTGKAYLFQKGTYFLVENLVWSLGLAVVLISLFMAYLFRNFRMIIISLIPNLLPLLITAGLMGYIGIPIKPSTILIFSIAFGISVDDTIHFLAKYRQELQENKWQVKKSVYNSVRETGLSMFYTSIVLFFGFSVFIVSNFGGTVALGSLVSGTLLLAMLSNLLLLPSLLLTLDKSIANEKVLKDPKIKILSDQEEL
ncbi:MAG: efflux RND transporter permease subunit [Flavobacteriaceae bacterium]|jgi:predicted RND superfamily exporter protein|nr:efflux RND transporter permease subunit [Flavobacteriaceae bacterium]